MPIGPFSFRGVARRKRKRGADIAAGGIVTTVAQDGTLYRVHTFLTDGVLTVNRSADMEYLVVAGGGGGGGGRRDPSGGGGGAGGLLVGNIALDAGEYPVSIGTGGEGGSYSSPGDNGENSNAFGLTAIGGGGGGAMGTNGRNGGSGGGAGTRSLAPGSEGGAGTPGQGFGGGNRSSLNGEGPSAAGGGATAPGENSPASGIAQGGAGLISDLSGEPVEYARGGNGNWRDGQIVAAQTASRGCGGQGGAGNSEDNFETTLGENGGSGIVIIRYQIGAIAPDGTGAWVWNDGTPIAWEDDDLIATETT